MLQIVMQIVRDLRLLIQTIMMYYSRHRSLILLTMLLVFTICWAPLNMINLMEDLEVSQMEM